MCSLNNFKILNKNLLEKFQLNSLMFCIIYEFKNIALVTKSEVN